MNRGIISKSLDWLMHPINSDGSISDWLAGFVLILILSFLWSTVVRQTIE